MCDADIIHASDLHLGEEKDETSLIPDAESIIVPEGVTELDSYLESVERGIITRALESNRWNKTATAQKLGIFHDTSDVMKELSGSGLQL